MSHHPRVLSAAVLAALTLTACGAKDSSTAPGAGPTTGPASATSTGPSAPIIEINPPGDIPDNQAYVTYQEKGFSFAAPEGWARSGGSEVVFSDKYNSITVTTEVSPTAPTPSSLGSGVRRIGARTPGYVAGHVTTVIRKAGQALLATYQAYSAVNPVTGKVAREAVEKYVFWKAGTAVTLTLEAPVGSDNVDPWRKVTDSFTWTR